MHSFRFTTLVLASLATFGMTSPALAHLHVNTTTPSDALGSKLSISSYGDPTFAVVDTGPRLEFQSNGTLFTLTTDTTVGTEYDALVPGLAGMQRVRVPNFTLDGSLPGNQNLFAPARTPGPMGYELSSVTHAVTGAALGDGQRVLWRLFTGGGGSLGLPAPVSGHATFAADSAGATTLERSHLLAVGAHMHGSRAVPDSGFFFLTSAAPGAYDVAIRAVDPTSEYFTASDPVTLRLNVVPEPASGLLIAGAALALLRRRR